MCISRNSHSGPKGRTRRTGRASIKERIDRVLTAWTRAEIWRSKACLSNNKDDKLWASRDCVVGCDRHLVWDRLSYYVARIRNWSVWACILVWVCVDYMHVCDICLVPVKVRAGCQIPWNWSDRWLWATMWVLGIEPGSSTRKPSAFNLWAISLAYKIWRDHATNCVFKRCFLNPRTR